MTLTIFLYYLSGAATTNNNNHNHNRNRNHDNNKSNNHNHDDNNDNNASKIPWSSTIIFGSGWLGMVWDPYNGSFWSL